jgi:cytochrome c biogenesis protein CcdA
MADIVLTEGCTRVACWLSTQGGLVSFPLITIAGIVDGVNPCAIGMMVMLLGYLLMFGQGNEKEKEKKVLRLGIIYILSVFLTYLVVGLGLYSLIEQLHINLLRSWINPILAVVLFVAGAIQIKDFFRPDLPIHLRIPTASKEKLMPLIEKASVPTTIGLGMLVTILETPCSLPIYVGTATILAQSGLAIPLIVAYFLYYNFLFVLPLIIALLVVWRAKKVMQMKEWEHKAEKWMKLTIGLVLVAMGIWLGWG